MKRMQHLPIWRDANRLLVAIETAVRHFPRYHEQPSRSGLSTMEPGLEE